MKNWFRKSEEAVTERPIDARTLPGVPDVFTGKDTTYGMQRKMATEIRDETWQTPVEKGLAMSLLAVIDDLEDVLFKPVV